MEALGFCFLFEHRGTEWASLTAIGDDGSAMGVTEWSAEQSIVDVEDPYAYVISANLHRRHLSIEDRRRIAAERLKADPVRSNRAIAAEVKLDKNTIQDVRQGLEASGEIHQSEIRVSTTGQKRKPAGKKAAAISEDNPNIKLPPPTVPSTPSDEWATRPAIQAFEKALAKCSGEERAYIWKHILPLYKPSTVTMRYVAPEAAKPAAVEKPRSGDAVAAKPPTQPKPAEKPKLSEEQIAVIRADYAKGLSQHDVTSKYGLYEKHGMYGAEIEALLAEGQVAEG